MQWSTGEANPTEGKRVLVREIGILLYEESVILGLDQVSWICFFYSVPGRLGVRKYSSITITGSTSGSKILMSFQQNKYRHTCYF